MYSSLGIGKEAVAKSLFEGRSGIVLAAKRKEMGYRSGLTGSVPRPDLKKLLDRRSRLMMPEQAEYAYVATVEAMEQAGIDIDFLDKNETGIIYVLFGRQAQTFKPYINKQFNNILEIEHPAYYARLNKRMPSELFATISNMCKDKYGVPIKWYQEY